MRSAQGHSRGSVCEPMRVASGPGRVRGMVPSPITSPVTRVAALAGPALFAAYGVTRHLDGLDGHRGDGALWDVGHVAFVVSTLAFAVLAVQLLRDVHGRWRPPVTWLAAAALTVTMSGGALVCWVLLMDLGAPVGPVPDGVVLGGPILLGVGLVALLLTQAGRRLPGWSPFTFLVADASVGLHLDLVTPAGLVMTAALWPLVRLTPASTRSSPPSAASDGPAAPQRQRGPVRRPRRRRPST